MTSAAAAVPDPGSVPLENARHERFCQEYMKDRNGTRAYLDAGYKSTPAAAGVGAARLLKSARVAERVAFLEARHVEAIGMTADDVLRELAVIGRSDVRHYQFGPGGQLALADGVPDEAARAVQSVKVRTRTDADGNTTEEIEYRLWNKPAALRMAGETHGLFRQKLEVEDKTPQMTEPGEVLMRRLAQEVVPRFAALLQQDQRLRMLKLIAGAEVVVGTEGGAAE